MGGNSKTLMICCVSPSGVNFYESLNALRYANRARNIKNKPIVNRDPTLVMVDELRKLIKLLAFELVEIRKNPLLGYPDGCVPLHELELLLLHGNMNRSRLFSSNTNIIADGPLSSSPSPLNYQLKNKRKSMSIVPFDSHFNQPTGSGSVRNSSFTGGTYGGTFSSPATPNASQIQNNNFNNFSLSSSFNNNNNNCNNNSNNHNNNNGNNNNNNDNASNTFPINEKKELLKELSKLKNKVVESDIEIKRLSDEMKRTTRRSSEVSEISTLIQSERDYYRMKYFDLNPIDAQTSNSECIPLFQIENDTKDNEKINEKNERNEKNKMTNIIACYIREIEDLKIKMKKMEQKTIINKSYGSLQLYDNKSEMDLESELTSNVCKVIAQTEKHLCAEAKRLKNIGVVLNLSTHSTNALNSSKSNNNNNSNNNYFNNSDSDSEESNDRSSLYDSNSSLNSINDNKNDNNISNNSSNNNDNKMITSMPRSQIETDDQTYQRKQKMMINDVSEINDNIELKEQLLGQLKRSNYQYSVMKTFYEKKLIILELEMKEKLDEKSRLTNDLLKLDNSSEKNENEVIKKKNEKEPLLRLLLQKKDEELKILKKKQDELKSLAKVQSKYLSQVTKLEIDIDNLKRQKVDLYLSLQMEKKKHFTLLNDKARDIDKLKRELVHIANNAKCLRRDKLKAEERAREVCIEIYMIIFLSSSSSFFFFTFIVIVIFSPKYCILYRRLLLYHYLHLCSHHILSDLISFLFTLFLPYSSTTPTPSSSSSSSSSSPSYFSVFLCALINSAPFAISP